MKKIIIGVFTILSLSSQAQTNVKLFEEEKLDLIQYKNHIGEVLFSNEDFERNLPESKYIKSYTLGDKLFIIAFTAHSPANSMLLQAEQNGIKPKEIKNLRESFSYQSTVYFKMYLDGKEITETSTAGFGNEELATLPTYRADINDGTNEEFYGETMYNDLLKEQNLLTPGTHKLKIEMVPVKKGMDFENIKYKAIAVGEIDLIVPKDIKVIESDCFPKTNILNSKLEAETLKAVKDFYKDGDPYSFKIILEQNGMKIIKNEYGVILRKEYIAFIVCKKGDEVWYRSDVLYKEYNGSGYENATVKGNASESTIVPYRKVNKNCLRFLK
ncbi:hypothetical protein [Chryseobacterium luteum]|uniref:Uncharacterized protein n=1 Tax=Chryseobacterium luteum TaxID=421531 RepID=A0A085YZK6_9FLAO|nr:hypothetical protein [Chryseobacterium luteum]KFE97619.1 hypothetical protein IX38_20345 [Chryseobacterium luteum]